MKRLSFILLLCAIVSLVSAQHITHDFHDVSLSDAMKYIQSQTTNYDVIFIYDELEDFRVTTDVRHKSVVDAIMQIVGFYPIRVYKSGEKEIYVECTHKTDHHLTGTIIDEKGLPVAYANVAILNPTDSALLSGGVSNESGYFAIPYEQERVLARISYVGYKTIYRMCDKPEVGTIRMRLDNYTLKGVMVKGERPQYQMGSEGLVTNVENTPLSNLGTGADVLKHVPGIIAKDNQYEVFGKGTPIIYINGRKMRNYRELEQLKSTDIKSIELITNPGAKYDATVGAVVKIQTVRKAGDGFSIDTWGRWQQSRKDKEAASLDMNYRKNGLDIFASLWASRGTHLQLSELTQEVQTDTLWQQRNDMRMDIVSRDYSIETGFNYMLNEHHSFGTKYEYTFPTNEDETTTLTSDVTANREFYDKWDNLTKKQTQGNAKHKLNVYYIGKVGKLDIDWNFDYLHSGYDEKSLIAETMTM